MSSSLLFSPLRSSPVVRSIFADFLPLVDFSCSIFGDFSCVVFTLKSEPSSISVGPCINSVDSADFVVISADFVVISADFVVISADSVEISADFIEISVHICVASAVCSTFCDVSCDFAVISDLMVSSASSPLLVCSL